MARREFPKAVKVAVVKRATVGGQVFCEACSLPAKVWQIDHVVADSHGGEPVIENAELICRECFSVKNPKDTTIAAKIKRVEAKALGVRKAPTLQAPARAPAPPQNKATKASPKLDALRALGRPNIYRSVM